jgi:hypothetical protein
MPSHFSSIGLPFTGLQEFGALARSIIDRTHEVFPVSGGQYLRWASRCGAEVWLQIGESNQIMGMAPHFAGSSSMRVGLTKRVSRKNDTPLDGAFFAWANPRNEDAGSGNYCFAFDAPDYLRQDLQLPSIVDVRVVAFAHSIECYSSPEAYDQARADRLKFASQCYIGSGMMTPDGDPIDPPESHAILVGHVKATQLKRNDLTGMQYFWAQVDALDFSVDVVVDPSIVTAPPQVGGVLSGSFWLSGRIQGLPG